MPLLGCVHLGIAGRIVLRQQGRQQTEQAAAAFGRCVVR
jgi:hypothetical protein